MSSSVLRPSRFRDRLHRRLHVVIKPGAILILQSSGIFSRLLKVLHQQALEPGDMADEELLVAQLHSALHAVPSRHMSVTISLPDALARLWMATPPGNAASIADCLGAAAQRFHALFDESPSDWTLSADLNARHAFLACAVPRSLVERIMTLCKTSQIDLLSLDTNFVMTWNQCRKQLVNGTWLAILEVDALTLGVISAGRLVAVRRIVATGDFLHSRAGLEQHIQREALLLNQVAPRILQVSGAMPPQWQQHETGQIQCLPLKLPGHTWAPGYAKTVQSRKGAV